jgi:hypothetical protein
MRFFYPLAVLWLLLSAASALAQGSGQNSPSGQGSQTNPPSQSEWTGPVVGGRHRQPTPAEIQARERAEGESKKAIQQRDRQEDKTIDELYKELMKPVPSSGQPGQ